nr:hypothetical protein [uncultured Neisseria sp.]
MCKKIFAYLKVRGKNAITNILDFKDNFIGLVLGFFLAFICLSITLSFPKYQEYLLALISEHMAPKSIAVFTLISGVFLILIMIFSFYYNKKLGIFHIKNKIIKLFTIWMPNLVLTYISTLIGVRIGAFFFILLFQIQLPLNITYKILFNYIINNIISFIALFLMYRFPFLKSPFNSIKPENKYKLLFLFIYLLFSFIFFAPIATSYWK